MKEEGTKNKSGSRQHKYAILSGFVIIALIIFILVDYVFVIRQSKVLAPEASTTTRTSTDTITESQDDSNKIEVSTPSNNFDSKGIESKKDETEIVLDDKNPNTYYDSGISNFNEGNYQEAIYYFNKAISLNNQDPKFYIKKSEVQIVLKEKESAIKTLNEGLANIPNNESLVSQLDFIKNVVK